MRRRAVEPRARDRVRRGAARPEERADPAHATIRRSRRPPTGNILLDRLVGAEIRWISRPAWRDRNRLLGRAAERVRAAGGRPYIVPEGGSNALGSWGYIRAMHELAEDLAGIAAPDHPVTVVYACGSGGTGAGLVLGASCSGLRARGIRVAGVNVCDDRAYFVDAIGKICADAEERWQLGAHVTPDDIDIVDGHVGAGYAKSRPEELATIRDVCRSDGVVLDPVYTGKAFHGVVHRAAPRSEALRRRGRVRSHRRHVRPVRVAGTIAQVL